MQRLIWISIQRHPKCKCQVDHLESVHLVGFLSMYLSDCQPLNLVGKLTNCSCTNCRCSKWDKSRMQFCRAGSNICSNIHSPLALLGTSSLSRLIQLNATRWWQSLTLAFRLISSNFSSGVGLSSRSINQFQMLSAQFCQIQFLRTLAKIPPLEIGIESHNVLYNIQYGIHCTLHECQILSIVVSTQFSGRARSNSIFRNWPFWGTHGLLMEYYSNALKITRQKH